MAPTKVPAGALELFKNYHGRLLQLEQERLDPAIAPTTPASMITPEMWPYLPRNVMDSLPTSSAPTFRPHEALPEEPAAAAAVIKQEADYMLRVFYILWSAFLDFRETTWSTHILRVTNYEALDPLIVIDDKKTDRWNGYWAKFPADRVKPLVDTTTRVQVLTTGSCLETASFTHLIEQVFEGMNVTLEEISFRLNPKHPTTRLLIDSTYTSPSAADLWCIRVTSRLTHRQWAIHLSGPQYAKLEPATPWPAFARNYIALDSDFLVLPFGTLRAYTAAMRATKGLAGMQHDLSARAMQAFHDTVDAAMARKKLTWTTVMHKSDEDFMRHADKILRVGNAAVETWMAGTGQLGKRRREAERWDRRHAEEMAREQERIWKEVKSEGKVERFDPLSGLEHLDRDAVVRLAMKMWETSDEMKAMVKAIGEKKEMERARDGGSVSGEEEGAERIVEVEDGDGKE